MASCSSSSIASSEVLGGRRINRSREGFSLRAGHYKPSSMRRSCPTMMLVKRRTPEAVLMPTSYAPRHVTQPFLSFLETLPRTDSEEKREEMGVAPEKLDDWLMDSIGEIVKNLSKAPFLMHLRCSGQEKTSSSTPTMELEKEQASPESWSAIKKRWRQHESRTPDAVILIEELNQTRMLPGNKKKKDDDAAARTWGLLVQGRGLGIDSVICYILSTTRVASLDGACTHFCLVRAKCDEPYWLQLRNAWLQR